MADSGNKNESRNEHGFMWPVVVKNANPHASLDYYYGPYESLDTLKASVPSTVAVPGFTAAVQTSTGVTEYWVTSGEGSTAIWQQKILTTENTLTLKGIKSTLADVEALTDMSVGDMWLVPETSSENAEYVWTGSAWEKMGVVSSVAHCTLTLKGAKFTVGETSTETSTFNNTQDVVLDLSGFVTANELDNLQSQVDEIEVNDGCLRIKWTTNAEVEEEDLFTANQAKDVTLDLSKFPLTADGIPTAWKTAIQSMIKEALTGYVYADSSGDLYRSEYNSTEDVVDQNPLEVNIVTGSITADAFYES
jgi:hypothetical protein